MPPKGRLAGPPAMRSAPRDNYARTVINELTSPENRTVVTAIGFFAVRLTSLTFDPLDLH